MKRFRFLPLMLGLLAGFLAAGRAAAQVTLSDVLVTSVSPSTAVVLWKTTAVGSPGIDLYSDAGGASSLAGQVGVEFYPLITGDAEVTNDRAEREERRTLQTATVNQLLVRVRLSGLTPGTTYYFRPRSYATPGGASNSGALLPLTAFATTASTSFPADVQLLRVDFSEVSNCAGMVAVVTGPAGTIPLSAVVGDGAGPNEAVFVLSDLVSAALQSNALLNGPVEFSISLHGVDAPEEPTLYTVTFAAGSFLTALNDAAFSSILPSSLVIDPVGTQRAGLAFTITVRALDAGGALLSTYSGKATISGVDFGGGQTPAFVGGRLSAHAVAINTPGTRQITITRSGVTGLSNAFTVTETLGSWRNAHFTAEELANPAISGPEADPGGRGVPNALRYAFDTGMNPPNLARLPAFGSRRDSGTGETFLTLSFNRSAVAEDIVYVVEASGNLSTWSEVQRIAPGLPQAVTVSDTVPTTVGVPRYMRVRIEQTSNFNDYLQQTLNAGLRVDPSATNPDGDYGGRGIPNLLRYAFNLDYTNPDPRQMPATSIDAQPGGDNFLQITFRRLATAGGNLRYLVQTSSGLMSPWVTIQTVYPGTPETVTVRDTSPVGNSFKFIRVVVVTD